MDDEAAVAGGAPVQLSRAGLAALFAYVDEAIVCCDPDGRIRFAGGAFTSLFGYDVDSVIGRQVLDYVHEDHHQGLVDDMARWVDRQGAPRGGAIRVRAADGSWLEVRYDTVIRDDLGPLGTIALTIVLDEADVQHDRELRARMLNEDRLVRLASTFLQIPYEDFQKGIDATLAELAGLEQVTRVSLWRREGERIIRAGVWEAPVDAPTIELGPRTRIDSLAILQRLAAGEEVGMAGPDDLGPGWDAERALFVEAGLESLLAVPMMSGSRQMGHVLLESTIGDITARAAHLAATRAAAAILAEAYVRHEAERQLSDQARTDRVTGLANRWAFDEAIGAARTALTSGASGGFALVLVDLDRFKVVNDSLGHGAGDLLLADVASRLVTAADDATTVARLGGDELLILLREADDLAAAGARAEALLGSLAAPFDVGGEPLVLTASAGVVHTSDPDVAPGELMRRADVAMYRVKGRGGDGLELDDPGTAAAPASSSLLHREGELRRAIDRGELVTYVQGEWDLATGSLVGAEALVRWRHPTEGLLDADEVIPVAETSGLIDRIGAIVLSDACRMAVPWREALGPAFAIRVNLSAHELRRGDLADRVADALDDSGLPPAALCLELTESSLLVDPVGSATLFDGLRELGVGLAVDDFGTGYSSIIQLKRMPLTALKIDRTFVAGLPDDATDRAIVDATVQLSSALGITVTAEGVETERQRDALLDLGCRRAQGFLFSRPELAADLARRIVAGGA